MATNFAFRLQFFQVSSQFCVFNIHVCALVMISYKLELKWLQIIFPLGNPCIMTSKFQIFLHNFCPHKTGWFGRVEPPTTHEIIFYSQFLMNLYRTSSNHLHVAPEGIMTIGKFLTSSGWFNPTNLKTLSKHRIRPWVKLDINSHEKSPPPDPK